MITYRFFIRTMEVTQVNNVENVVSHIHFDYIGTDENGKTAFCQGVVPFILIDHVSINPETGEQEITKGIFDENNYIPYNQLTQDQVLSWLESNVPAGAISAFQEIITDKINTINNSNENLPLPWN